MLSIRQQIEKIADYDIPVLILGESGTGKEVVARFLHTRSANARQPFLKVNCAALPGPLLESELFGYERGAFTGAVRNPGKFEICKSGTILLDEIGEISPALQAKLLHVLQDKTVCRLGGNTTIRVQARVIAATNVDICEALESGALPPIFITASILSFFESAAALPGLRKFPTCMSTPSGDLQVCTAARRFHRPRVL